MAIIVVTLNDTLDTFRTKFNSLSEDVGDIGNLLTPITTDIVNAMNSLQGEIEAGISEDQLRDILFTAIALA